MAIYKRKQSEFLGFLNAGGSPGQYDDFICGINETVNPKQPSQFIYQDGLIFHDPSEDNTGLGENPIRQFGLHDYHGTGFLEPQLNDTQAKQLESLLNSTKAGYEYHDLVGDYTRSSKALNSSLRKSYMAGEQPKRFIHITDDPDIDFPFDVGAFDKMISRHKLPHDITVYSGIHWNPREHSGKIVTLPAYTSTSLSPHVAKDFGKIFLENDNPIVNVLKLNVPQGHSFLSTEKGSTFPGQAEIILPRNLRIQVGAQPIHHILGNFDEHWGYPKKIQHFQIWHGKIIS